MIQKKRKLDNLDSHKSSKPSSIRQDKARNRTTEGQQANPSSENARLPPFSSQVHSLYLPLPPLSQLHPLSGISAEHLSPLILTYYPPFGGIVLSYSKAQLSQDPYIDSYNSSNQPVLAKAIDEFAASHVWVRAEFLLFKPRRGNQLEGWVNLQNESHISLVCWNLFNASIERKRLPQSWKWISRPTTRKAKHLLNFDQRGGQLPGANSADCTAEDDTGYFQDKDGRKIEGSLQFYVKDVDFPTGADKEKGIISIVGTCLSGCEERGLLEQEQLRSIG